MRKPSIPYELLASFAAMRAKRREEILLAQGELTMNTDPRDPTQVPDPMRDEVKEGNPLPSDFNDDPTVEDEDLEFEEEDEEDDDE